MRETRQNAANLRASSGPRTSAEIVANDAGLRPHSYKFLQACRRTPTVSSMASDEGSVTVTSDSYQ